MTEQQYRDAAANAGLQPIAFNPPAPPPGLQGCTGIARVGICVRCDRLYISGPQLSPKAKPAADGPKRGVYGCVNQVIGGVHVTSIPRESGVAQTVKLGGEVVTTPAHEGSPE